MSYTPTVWVAPAGTNLNKFAKTSETSTDVILSPNPDSVTVAGTPINTTNLNKMETGIKDVHNPAFTEAATLENIATGEVVETLWGKVKKAIATIIAWLDQSVKTTASPTFSDVSITNNATVGGTLGVTGAISGATVDTGQGANEVFRMSNLSVIAGPGESMQIAAMKVGEVIFFTFQLTSTAGNAVYVMAPSVGTDFLVMINSNGGTIKTTGGYTAAGGLILLNNQASTVLANGFVRRIS